MVGLARTGSIPWSSLLFLCIEVGLATGARAASPAVTLSWEAPEGCPDHDDLQRRLRRYLGDALARPHVDPITARATVVPHAQGWLLELVIESSGGRAVSRTVGETCGVLAEVAALKIAITLDPIAVLDRFEEREDVVPEPPRGIPAPSPDRSRTEPKLVAPASAREVSRRRSPRAALRAAAGIGYGTVPGLAVPVVVAGALVWERARLDLGVTGWTPSSIRYPERPEVGGTMSLISASIDACAVLRASNVEFPLCAGLELGGMLGWGTGLRDPARAARFWMAARVAPTIVVRLHPVVAPFLQVIGLFPWVRPGFAVDQLGELYRAPYAGVAAIVGIELRWPRERPRRAPAR